MKGNTDIERNDNTTNIFTKMDKQDEEDLIGELSELLECKGCECGW